MNRKNPENLTDLSVVIPTWNGLHLLQENIPSIMTALEYFKDKLCKGYELIIVDDGSTDGTENWVTKEYPKVNLIRWPINNGFSKACNAGFKVCHGQVVALLNNDLQLDQDYFVHLYPHFTDDNVFAVTTKVFEWNSNIFACGGRIGHFRRGFWSMYSNYDVQDDSSQDWIEQHRLLSACAIGGFAGYSRNKLNCLGGFNELFSPFYWEDIDLSYRAWKRGWKVHYEPRSRSRHRTSATINSSFDKHFVKMHSFKNRLLFHWINIHTSSYLLRHILVLVFLLMTRLVILDLVFYRALWEALSKIGPALICRRIEKREAKMSDFELYRLLQDFYRKAPIEVFRSQKEVIQHHIGTATDPIQDSRRLSI